MTHKTKPHPHSDWTAFKRIRARVLERFARRSLHACRAILERDDGDALGRMVALAELFDQRSRDLRLLEQFQSRSKILTGLAQFKAFDLLDEHDLASLSPETRARIEALGDTPGSAKKLHRYLGQP